MSTFESLIDNLTPKQTECLNQFREVVGDVLQPDHDDFFLLRWLKARNFDLQKAELMLRKSLEWRKNNNIDEIWEWEPPHVLKKYWPGGVFGVDKTGHPVLWALCDRFDAMSMMKCAKKSDIIKYHIYRMEQIMKICRAQTKKLGRRIGSAVHISDLKGFSLKMMFTPGISDTMRTVFAIYEANYPEHLHSSYVINAPGVFPVIFTILRPFLSEETKKKVHILGKSWRSSLSDVMDPDQLPVYWGGNCRAPDDLCSDYLVHCSEIPENLYLRDHVLIDREKMTVATVPRGGVLDVPNEVATPGTVIRWLFETEHKDIGFGVWYHGAQTSTMNGLTHTHGDKPRRKSSETEPEEVIKVSRVNSQLVPEDGSITCARPGTYTLHFDNTYSWVSSKQLRYEVEVLEPVNDPILENCFVNLYSESTHL